MCSMNILFLLDWEICSSCKELCMGTTWGWKMGLGAPCKKEVRTSALFGKQTFTSVTHSHNAGYDGCKRDDCKMVVREMIHKINDAKFVQNCLYVQQTLSVSVIPTVSYRSEYTSHIFWNILLCLFMWQHWRNYTLLQCKVVSVQLV